ncbi:MAG: DUF262 domain-containing protein [Thermoplasmata archaeon]|nr:DUF262 domain-containing protein [Thermoplasmata archaeon]
MRARPLAIGELRGLYPSLAVSGYQRAVVWGLGQRAALIRSFLERYPTGLIVLNRLGAPKKAPKVDRIAHHLPRVEIIDGQQRLTTVFDFLQDPLIYFTSWAPRLPSKIEEPKEIKVVRERLDSLHKELRRLKAQFAPPKTGRHELLERIASHGRRELQRREGGEQVEDPRFHSLVDSLAQLKSKVSRCRVVVEELDGLNSPDAERIYDVINSSGTRLKWWELLWGQELFVHTEYAAVAPYRTRRNEQVERVAQFYRLKNIPRDSPIRAVAPQTISLWHSMYALGHYCYNLFGQHDPKIFPKLTVGSSTKPKVDGLGFRLVSTFLAHDVSRAAVYDLLDEYSVDQIRQTIDILFDTADTLFDPGLAGDYQFFSKYAAFYADPVPAYPVVGLFVAASKFLARNRIEGNGSKLTTKDSTAMRALTEELFRESICTSNWAGTGDSRLKDWLDTHFEVVATRAGDGGAQFPGAIRPLSAAPKAKLWTEFLAQQTGTGRRVPDRKVASFHFWIQYILDSGSIGVLPRGMAQYDPIVPFNRNYPQTTHPLNLAVISADLNRSKRNLTYSGWDPSEEEDRRYRQQVLCRPEILDLPVAAAADFLKHATFTDIDDMLEERRKVFEVTLTSFLPRWISQGDLPTLRSS